MREKLNKKQSVESWVRFNCSILRYCPGIYDADENPWKDGGSSEFWEKNKVEIMQYYEQWAKNRRWYFTRPEQYFYELEEKYPRKVKRIKSWGPWTSEGAPKEPTFEEDIEGDEEYLRRLDLLFDFERAMGKKRGKTSKKAVEMDENGLETAKIELETKNKDNE
jgi:hypothetical protein